LSIEEALQHLADAVDGRLALVAERRTKSAAIAAAHRALMEALAPLVDDAGFNLQLALQSAIDGKGDAAEAKKASEAAGREIVSFQAMLGLRAEANLVLGLLNEVTSTSSTEQLGPLKERFTASASRSTLALKELTDGAKLAALTASLLAHGEGARTVFE